MSKQILTGLLLVLMVITGISCKTTLNVTSDYDKSADFNSYKTFGMYTLTSTKNINMFNLKHIVTAIRTEMKKKGFVETDNNPDLVINAVSVLLNRQSVSSTTNYYGYGGLYRPYAFWGTPGRIGAYKEVQTNNYKDGTLLIDVIDTKTQRMVWQGIGNAEINKKPKNPEKIINKSVAKIMKTFPSGFTYSTSAN